MLSFLADARYENEAALMKDLLKDYDPGFRPVKTFSTPINISMTFSLKRIESLVSDSVYTWYM